ncbi:hypothetical protein PybrP1_006934 [[Pythium] brassicae (nom. inval.)]|nr:hypothetical protein PybrP1_006934 [[Pythium] brassicae (nom. inval.)]
MFPGHSKDEWMYVVNAWIVGGMIGSLTSGFFADKLASFLLIESPAWLIMKAKPDEAATVMVRLYGEENVSLAFTWFEPQGASSDIESSRVESKAQTSSELAAQTTQILFYSSILFEDAGISDDRVGSVIVNIMNLLPSFTVGYLANQFGYRRLLLTSFLGMFASSVGTTVARLADVFALSIVFTRTYVAFFATSLGPLIYVVLSTLFPDAVRGTAVAICVSFTWIANLLTGTTFPYISDGLGKLAFLPFVDILALSSVFTYTMVPET